MRIATIVSLGASVVLGIGALAVFRISAPVHSATAATAAAPASAGVPVVVASRDLAYGAVLESGALTVVRMPAGAAPAGAFTNVAEVVGRLGTAPVVLTPISAHEAILASKISGPGARPTLSAGIGDGLRAYTIRVSDIAGVGGHALPGDHVDVLLTQDLAQDRQLRHAVSALLIQNVRVLGMDLNIDPASTKSQEPRTATLEVSAADAVRLAAAADSGTLSLSLRRMGSAEIAEAPSVDTGDMVGHATGVAPVPTALRGPTAPIRKRIRPQAGGRASESGVIIVSGASAQTVKVPADNTGTGA